jgi:chromosome segregation ATPase
MKVAEMEKEISHLNIQNKKIKTSAKEKINSAHSKFEDLQNKLNKITKKNEELEAIAVEEKNIAEKDKIKENEYQKILEEIENLKFNLEQKEIQIAEQKKSIASLKDRENGLSYQLSIHKDYENQLPGLKKEIQKQKLESKKKDEKFQEIESKQFAVLKSLKEKLKKSEFEVLGLQAELRVKDAAIKSLQTAIEEMRETQRKNAKQCMQKVRNFWDSKTGKKQSSKKKEYEELKEENKQLQILLGMRESFSDVYENPKKKFKNDDVSADNF